MIDIGAIRTAYPLLSVLDAAVKLRRAGNEWKGCCPFHSDRSPSFTIYAGGERFHCFGCGAQGDVLDYVARLHGVSMVEAARLLTNGDVPQSESATPPTPDPDRPHRIGEALRIWENAIPASGTLAETYLASRGISGAIPADIRFSWLPYGKSEPLPCLLAAVRDIAGEVTGLQRIYLRDDGRGKANILKPKLSLGKVAGGAIKLGNLNAWGTVTVCEGPEDGLTLLHLLGPPVWVAAGASMLPGMMFPPEVRSVVVGADNDDAGNEAARKAAHAFAMRGLTARIIHPLPRFKDFNDELRGNISHG